MHEETLENNFWY